MVSGEVKVQYGVEHCFVCCEELFIPCRVSSESVLVSDLTTSEHETNHKN